MTKQPNKKRAKEKHNKHMYMGWRDSSAFKGKAHNQKYNTQTHTLVKTAGVLVTCLVTLTMLHN